MTEDLIGVLAPARGVAAGEGAAWTTEKLYNIQ